MFENRCTTASILRNLFHSYGESFNNKNCFITIKHAWMSVPLKLFFSPFSPSIIKNKNINTTRRLKIGSITLSYRLRPKIQHNTRGWRQFAQWCVGAKMFQNFFTDSHNKMRKEITRGCGVSQAILLTRRLNTVFLFLFFNTSAFGGDGCFVESATPKSIKCPYRNSRMFYIIPWMFYRTSIAENVTSVAVKSASPVTICPSLSRWTSYIIPWMFLVHPLNIPPFLLNTLHILLNIPSQVLNTLHQSPNVLPLNISSEVKPLIVLNSTDGV